MLFKSDTQNKKVYRDLQSEVLLNPLLPETPQVGDMNKSCFSTTVSGIFLQNQSYTMGLYWNNPPSILVFLEY